jgi:hypothetical protein
MIGATIDVQDARVRSTVDHGPPKMRRRFTAAYRAWDFSIYVTGSEKAVLETWYTSTLSQGVTAFDWTDETGTVGSFRFMRPPRYTLKVGHQVVGSRLWEVGIGLEQVP